MPTITIYSCNPQNVAHPSAIPRPSRVAAGATDVELFYLMDVLESLGFHQACYCVYYVIIYKYNVIYIYTDLVGKVRSYI